MKLWAGRLSGGLDETLSRLNNSIGFDQRMWRQDIGGSIAHATMLGEQGIIDSCESAKIVAGLRGIYEDLDSGKLEFDLEAEDIHTFIEAELTARIGDTGKRLHTGRSRNDQVALDLRLYLMAEIDAISDGLRAAIDALLTVAQQHLNTVMPGYTHLQRAQPVTLAHCLAAYAHMLSRDLDRLTQTRARTAVSPLGAGALAGTTYPLDMGRTAQLLGMERYSLNSLDAVSDRDFVLELAFDLSAMMMHLSRLAEEVTLWCSIEFGFMTLSDTFSTGSSIMPQKKNPDIAELLRGKAARVYGSLTTLLAMMKGMPLAYNKDMQEDKEAIFDTVDTARLCLDVVPGMLTTATFYPERMWKAAGEGFINATDCADYLVGKGRPFRDAYRAVGQLVAHCIETGLTLSCLSLDKYRRADPLFDCDVFDAVNLSACVHRRCLPCGPAPEAVSAQIEALRQQLGQSITTQGE